MSEGWARFAELADRIAAGERVSAPDLSEASADTFDRAAVGLVIDEVSWDRISAHLDAGPAHWQTLGIVHGGVWCTVVETLASWGAALRAVVEGRHVVGVTNTTDFLRPHRSGRVDAVARPVDVGELQQLWEVSINRVSDGSPVAHGQVRLHALDLRADSAAEGQPAPRP
jgi:1,4-dihydroxy-2-naphthoyl-CoA hydrolase